MTSAPLPAPVTAGSLMRGAILGQKRYVGTTTALYMVHQASEATVPVLAGVIIDRAVATGDGTALAVGIVALLGLFIVLSSGYRLGSQYDQKGYEFAVNEIRLQLLGRVLDPGGGLRDRRSGELLSMANSDAEWVAEVNPMVATAIAAITAVSIAAAVLFTVSVPLGLLVIIGLPPLVVVIHYMGKPLAARGTAEQEAVAHASALATDQITGLRVLKGLGAESIAGDRYRGASRTALVATLRMARAEAIYEGASVTLIGVFLAVVALFGGRLAIEGDISVGALIAALGLTQFLIGPLNRVSYIGETLIRARASATRIAAVLNTPPSVRGTQPLPAGTPPQLEARGVAHDSLRDVSFVARQGELLGVVAFEPRDAQALVDVLGHDVEPASGQLLLGGVDVAGVDPAAYRRIVVVAPHEADLFEYSLSDNVAVGAADPALVPVAIAAAAADEVAEALPDGEATRLAERGRSLSGGQRQRVALARALATGAPVLVLHEPTTAVDAVTEARIAPAFRTLRGGRSTVLVTSSPALLVACDRVIVIEDGRVVDEGAHTDLVQSNQRYRSLVLA